MVWQRNEPIRVDRILKPLSLTEPKPGVYVYDFGQNIVGWCSLKVKGAAGTTVTLRHAEMINEDGTIYTANLRGAPQVDRFILRGAGEEPFEPHFTYHGFRYVELTGLRQRPSLDSLVGKVIHSAAPDVGPLRVLERPDQPTDAQHPLDSAGEPDEFADRLSRSGTSASAGWGTSRPSHRRRCST